MMLSEADLGKIFWRVLAGASIAAGDALPRFTNLPLDLRAAVTQTAVEVYDSADEQRGDSICTRLASTDWSAGRYDPDTKTIAFAQPPNTIPFGIAIMIRSASCAIVALKEV